MAQRSYHFGGEGPPLHLALANGFPAESYVPMFRPLLESYGAFSLLPRALWDPRPTLESAPTWETMADDILAGLAQQEIPKVVGVGHSMGGVATLLAAAKAPERFYGIALLDPVLLPPWILAGFRLLKRLNLAPENPLARGARARVAHFQDADDAYRYWRPKKLFHDWSDEVMRLYAEGLTQPSPSGGVELSWPPAWEVHYYNTLHDEVWKWLKGFQATGLPILTLRGTTSNTFFPRVERRMLRLLGDQMTARQIPGHGHLFPQSAPEQTASHLKQWLEGLFSQAGRSQRD